MSRYSYIPSQGQQQGCSQTCHLNFVRRYIEFLLTRSDTRLPQLFFVLLCTCICLGIELCVLCDSDPPLPVLQENVKAYWSPVEHQLRNCCLAFPRCLPLSLTFDQSVLALCLVNLDKRKSLTCLSPSSSSQSRTTLLTAGEANINMPITKCITMA